MEKHPEQNNLYLSFFQTGLSGNIVILSVFYYGGLMMSESQLTVGDLTAFLLYAAYTGMSMGGKLGEVMMSESTVITYKMHFQRSNCSFNRVHIV